MSESTPSPMKQKIKGWLGIGTNDGGDDPKEPPSTPKSPKRKRVSSSDRYLAKRLKHVRETYPKSDTRDLPESPRDMQMLASSFYSFINPDKLHMIERTPPRETVNRYQATGAQFEDWMANTNSTGPACPVVQSTLTLANLVGGNSPEFIVSRSYFVVPPAEIRDTLELIGLPHEPKSKNYRYIKLYRPGNASKVCTYEHYIVPGAVIVQTAYRRQRGPQWYDIALALYKHDAAIDTLQYVYYTSVENEETQPLVGKVIYPSNNIPGAESTAGSRMRIWRMHTPEFQQILGSQLGRATSRLVLAAWPRGTHQIPRVNTWFLSGNLHMRFDIEPIARASPRPSHSSHSRHPPPSPPTPTPSSRRPRRSGSGAA